MTNLVEWSERGWETLSVLSVRYLSVMSCVSNQYYWTGWQDGMGGCPKVNNEDPALMGHSRNMYLLPLSIINTAAAQKSYKRRQLSNDKVRWADAAVLDRYPQCQETKAAPKGFVSLLRDA